MLYNNCLMIFRERREHRVYRLLLEMVPGLEERLLNGSEEDLIHIADLVGGRKCVPEPH